MELDKTENLEGWLSLAGAGVARVSLIRLMPLVGARQDCGSKGRLPVTGVLFSRLDFSSILTITDMMIMLLMYQGIALIPGGALSSRYFCCCVVFVLRNVFDTLYSRAVSIEKNLMLCLIIVGTEYKDDLFSLGVCCLCLRSFVSKSFTTERCKCEYSNLQVKWIEVVDDFYNCFREFGNAFSRVWVILWLSVW